MLLARRLRSWLGSSSIPPPRTRPPVRRLMLEPLEDRSVPATVNSLGDSGNGTLRDAILNAAPGDTINFSGSMTGVIRLESTLTIDKNLTINGPGRDKLVVSGMGQFSEPLVRVFTVFAGVSVSFSGLTIWGGRGSIVPAPGGLGGGGGINCAGGPGSSLTVTDCNFADNRSASLFRGGAIHTNNTTLTVNNCHFGGDFSAGGSENFSYNIAGRGACIGTVGGSSTVTNCTFTGNVAGSGGEGGGGAIYNDGGTMSVSGSTFDFNFSLADAGAIWNKSGVLTVSSSIFTGNIGRYGGAIYSEGGTATIDSTTFSNNRAGRSGGAIAIVNGTLSMTNCQVNGNSSSYEGGGVFIDPSVVTIISCTITGNTAPAGADLYTLDSSLTLVGSTVGDVAGVGSTVTVTDFLSYATAILDDLESEVAALGLSSAQQDSLMASLEEARQALIAGNSSAAAGQLGSFVNKLNALVNSRRLGEITADSLISEVDDLLILIP